MISTYNDYIDYFSALAVSHVDINGFVKGLDAEMHSELKDRVDDPVMVLESPDIRPGGTADSLYETWSCAMEIVGHTTIDDYDEHQAILNAMLIITKDIRNKIFRDAEDNDWEIDPHRFTIVPVVSVMLDNYFGWRLDFSFEVAAGYCDDSKFV